MDLDRYDYELPDDAIAQEPVEPRDRARLLVHHRRSRTRDHRRFRELPAHLYPGDCLVFNQTRVLRARLHGHRAETGGKVEILLLHRRGDGTWVVLARPAKKVRPGEDLVFAGGALQASVSERRDEGQRVLDFGDVDVEAALKDHGEMPLPPYIDRPLEDPERYQTIYAEETGSAAAPTAGLHFTETLLDRLRDRDVRLVFITLHVGLGTFQPIRTDDVGEHDMHAEYYHVSAAAADAMNSARQGGGRIVAVGTTVTRTLETVVEGDGAVRPGSGWTDLFITPGHRFRAVDALITNFHLPKTTLLLLVAAFAGREPVLTSYREAVANGYRFYSFGDAMFIV